jgi:uncharacterized protein (DUF488 family)
MADEDLSKLLANLTVWTIGHSTREGEEFNKILKTHHISNLVDVRSFPASRRYPHFNKSELLKALASVNVNYYHSPQLGGRRKPSADSKNTAWKNASFRAYADHMETKDFRQGVDGLVELARDQPTAVMCAEAVWWRCHRSLIADYLKSMGAKVIHILDESKTEEHPYTTAARIVDGRLSYEGLLGS